MKLSVDEFIDMTNRTNQSLKDSFKEGVEHEQRRPLPNNLFDAILDYAKKSKTLIDYHKSSNEKDGCNWIQLKPTREGSEKVKNVELSFENNLTEINYIGASTED